MNTSLPMSTLLFKLVEFKKDTPLPDTAKVRELLVEREPEYRPATKDEADEYVARDHLTKNPETPQSQFPIVALGTEIDQPYVLPTTGPGILDPVMSRGRFITTVGKWENHARFLVVMTVS